MPEPFEFYESYDYPDIVAPRPDLSDEHRAAVMPDHVRELIAKRLAEKEERPAG